MKTLRIGVDIGGTFTDFVVLQPDTGRLETFKLPSTPDNPAQAVLDGLKQLPDLNRWDAIEIVHGSTVATNALLERKGARTALVTSLGFRDVLQIGRQNRPDLYDLLFEMPPPLVPALFRLEVNERVDHNGIVLQALSEEEIDRVSQIISVLKPEAVAVCLLFSFLHPAHEAAIAIRLRQEGYLVSLSSEILPEYREYERTSTTVVNAYVTPVLDRYLTSLEQGLRELVREDQVRLRVMQSNGGAISPAKARETGVHCILSGPAGGLIGSSFIAQRSSHSTSSSHSAGNLSGLPRLITFDMGGTSTDVSLLYGKPAITVESAIGGMPVRVPLLDIHTIGAGGGSIAQIDPGGALRVGPQSAGANPGPACYGRGELATVTDANLVLGRLVPEHFLGGRMHLDIRRAEAAIDRLAKVLGLDRIQTALGIIEVANAHMERALRVISVERGHDPRDFTLFSFGGAGGLHACELAFRLGTPQVLISPYASVLSALGMLAADVVKDFSLTVMLPGDVPREQIDHLFAPILERSQVEIVKEGIQPDNVHLEISLDMRYRGQSYELVIPYTSDFLRDFHAAHHQEYGYARRDAPVEIVNLRVRAVGTTQPPTIQSRPEVGAEASSAIMAYRPAHFSSGSKTIPFYQGDLLSSGNYLEGPAIVVYKDTTILIPEQVPVKVDRMNNLILTIHEHASSN